VPLTLAAGPYRYEVDAGWGQPPDESTFAECAAVSVDANDNVWAFNIPTGELMIFAPDGSLARVWPHRYENVHGIDFDADGNVYLVNRNDHEVSKYTPDGELVMTLGTPGVPSDTGYSLQKGRDTSWANPVERAGHPFNVPSGVRIAPNGDVYVANGYANSRIHRFSAKGELLHSWGEPGKGGPGEFHLVHGLFIDSRGRVLICDRLNNRIQIYDLKGDFLGMWSGFRMPSKVHQGPDGVIAVTEHAGRLSILNLNGTVLGRFGAADNTGLFAWPHGIAIDSKGSIYVGHVTAAGAPTGSGQRLTKLTQI
jgi:sugar lactone lactonase YvrE